MKRILIINGSLQGKNGNTSVLIDYLLAELNSKVGIDYLELKNCPEIAKEEKRFSEAAGFVFATGTYWQSWSHHAQRFFEQATPWEGSEIWLGKPVCSLVTMHSVGGMEVLSRIQSNFSLFGAVIPPMCAIVHSYVNQLASRAETMENENLDIWGVRDLSVVAHNLMEAVSKTHHYKAWKVDTLDAASKIWMKQG
jgi:multimeric flavodoxin WrbA